MERVQANTEWTLLDPYEVQKVFGIKIASLWGYEFKRQYSYIEDNLDKLTLYKKVKAREVFKDIMRTQLETGLPYLSFKDTINQANPNIHDGYIPSVNLCVAPETKILTKEGYIPIYTLKDKEVEVWNGEQWSTTIVKQTGTNETLIKIEFSNDEYIECTFEHEFYIQKPGQVNPIKVQAKLLRPGDELIVYKLPVKNEQGEEVYVEQNIKVTNLEFNDRKANTFCFNEPLRHMGVFNGILAGQCVESFSNVKSGEYAHCCNLVSLNLANITRDLLPYYCELAVRLLDNSIEITTAPIGEAARHNNRYRTIGVGVMGLADYLVKNQLMYVDLEEIDKLFEDFGYYCTKASADLAKTRGSFDAFDGSTWSKGQLVNNRSLEWIEENSYDPLRWKLLQKQISIYGIRNSQVTAIAPNTSSSLIQGCTASILPVYSKFFYDKAKKAVPVAPPYYNQYKWYYTENKYMNQEIVVRAVARMQKWVDTGISMELVFNLNEGIYWEDEPSRSLQVKDIYNTLLLAWQLKCKAIYYIRSVQKDDYKSCTSCSN